MIAFLFSTTILSFAAAGPYQKGFALRYAQGQDSKRKVRNRKPHAEQWFVFKSPDSDFRLSFPEKPALKQIEQGTVTIIRSYEVTSHEETVFSVNFQDIGGDPLARENNEWNTNLEVTLAIADRAQNIRVIQTHRLAKNIIESELLLSSPINGAELNQIRRSILRHARIYTLGCGSVIDKKPVDKHACERFFNSMQFVSAKKALRQSPS